MLTFLYLLTLIQQFILKRSPFLLKSRYIHAWRDLNNNIMEHNWYIYQCTLSIQRRVSSKHSIGTHTFWIPFWLQFVYDKDTFSLDDKMGDAEFEISSFLEAIKFRLENVPSGTIICKVQPNRLNCLAEESHIIWTEGRVVQNMVLRLRNVECGEVELQLHWIDIPGSRGV